VTSEAYARDYNEIKSVGGQVSQTRTAATILDTWHTMGMPYMGSADYAVRDLFVPDHLTVPVSPRTQMTGCG
jgi:hypothetical protein